ncbi:DUF3500 domain-containing protein [Prosthecobacter sp.]|uniref:DUF3500 domain-containing protein n=1 Tax=Prosthecobacter sp. TaxID=1965333 RepID=UPI003783D643
MNTILAAFDRKNLSRREILRTLGATAAFTAFPSLRAATPPAAAKDSLPTQFYKSLTEEQRAKIVLPRDHPQRGYVSNWWYICPEQRLHTFYTPDQQDLVRQIFESLHHPDHREKMNWQVQKDLMGKIKNTPSVGFFGTPADPDFEFIYTGHHVTRRCHAHTDQGLGFGGRPIFYGNFAKAFNETKDHEGNPFWYQGLVFNEFVQALDGKQQEKILVGREPRPESPAKVIEKRKTDLPGLSAADLSKDQQAKLLETMRRMLVCFRPDDVAATLKTIQDKNLLPSLFISCYGGKYDIGADKVWDTWQIESPDFVWYFRGHPHIHGYFHLPV